jgi:hypothetical protein
MQDCTCSPDDGLFHCKISSNPNNGKSCIMGYKPGDPLYDGLPNTFEVITYGIVFILIVVVIGLLVQKIAKKYPKLNKPLW